ncbi:MAG: ATP synthase F1 subunit gamma [Candidatus Berkelbacteria bacterium]
MPSTQEFRRRIKSVGSIKQITKAMEMIASIKMQKSTKTIAQARSYIQNAWNILHLLASKTLDQDHPLLKPREVKKTAVILITSDRGLCGSYNSEVIKKFVNFEKNECACNSETKTCGEYLGNCDVIAIGKVGAGYVNRYKIGKLIAEFKGFENNISIEDVVPISKLTNGEYLDGHYDRVVVIYSHFISSLKQLPVVKQILPIVEEHIDNPELWEKVEIDENIDFKFEPNPEAVIDGVLKQIVRSQILGAILEANASEHSARMVAMKNATDNATDLVDELKLVYNSIRQGNITSEIAEISGAAEAMK